MRAVCIALLVLAGGAAAVAEEGVVTFRCVDGSGAVVAGAEVTWLPYVDGVVVEEPMTHVATDENGECTIDFRSELSYEANNFSVRAESGDLQAHVRVYPKREESPRQLTMKSAMLVTGRVTDEQGGPIEGAIVGIPWFPLATTDDQGRFSFGKPSEEAYGLSVFKEGYVPVYASGSDGEFAVALEKGERITLEARDAGGNVIEGANLYYRCGPVYEYEVFTDASGTARTLPLPAGESVQISGSFRREDQPGISGMVSYDVTQERGQKAVLTLTEPQPEDFVTISGRVLLRGADTPVRADILCDRNRHDFEYSARSWAETAEDGSFTIDRRLGTGRYFIKVKPVEGTQYAVDGIVAVDATKGSVDGLILYVDAGCLVHGRLVAPEGEELKRTWIVVRQEGQELRMVMPSERGSFVIPNLPPTPARVSLGVDNERVTVDLPGPGERVSSVKVPVRGVMEKASFSGTVVDESGQPLAALRLNFDIESADGTRRGAHGTTDGAGRFHIESEIAGTGRLSSVYASRQIVAAGNSQGQSYACTIVSAPEPFVLRSGETRENVQIVAALPSMRMIVFHVADEGGAALEPQVNVWMAEKTDNVGTMGKEGTYTLRTVPDEPFAVVFELEGYQARVLQVDRDFTRDEEFVHVTLTKGPFPEGEELWTLVTGAPYTQEAVDAAVRGNEIRRRLERYAAVAAKGDRVEQMAQRPAIAETVAVLVVDGEGRPVTRITTRRVTAHQRSLFDGTTPVRVEEVYPLEYGPGESRSVLANEGGTYEVPNGSLIQAEGLCRALVAIGPDEVASEPLRIELARAYPIEIVLTQGTGGPVTKGELVPVRAAYYQSGQTPGNAVRLDAQGRAVIEDFPAGDYAFALVTERASHRAHAYIFAHHDGTGATRVERRVGPWPPDSPEALLGAMSGRQARVQDDGLATRWENLSRRDRAAVGKAAREELESTLFVIGRDIYGVAAVAALAGETEAVPALQRLMRNDSPESYLGFEERAFAFAIADLDGDEAVPFFEAVAVDESVSALQRTAAVMALGRIGSEASVAAWKRLRDAARERDGAPVAKAEYTHAERMAEALSFTLLILPGREGEMGATLDSATVDDEYATGTIGAGDFMSGYTTYRLRRVGDEWLVVDIEGTVIS